MNLDIINLTLKEESALFTANQTQIEIEKQLHKLDKQNRNILEEIMLRKSRIEILNGMLEEEK